MTVLADLPQKPRIVIVGGGAAGLSLATQLGKQLGASKRAEIVLVDLDAAYVWKPMLHTVAAGTFDTSHQQTSYLAQAARNHFRYWPGEMIGLDRAARHITLAPVRNEKGEAIIPERTLDYDLLILAVGSRANDFGTPGVQQYCHFIEGRREASRFNDDLRRELLQTVTSKEQDGVAIVGGGATGVQLAAEITHMLDLIGAYGVADARRRFQLYLLEKQPHILAGFPDAIVQEATHQLEQVGVKVMTSTEVASVDAAGVSLGDGTKIGAPLKVWAAGVKAPDFLHGIDGLESLRNGRLVVGSTLQTSRDERIFALGDCAGFTPNGEQQPLPTTAQVANQQAWHLSKHLAGWLAGKPLPPFEYHDRGKIVSLSDYNAFGVLGNYGFFKGSLLKGWFAQFGHIYLYRRFQTDLYGRWHTALKVLSEKFSRLSQPKIRLD